MRLPFVAFGLLLACSVANADITYTFTASETTSFSFSVPSYITTAGSFAITPFTVNGFTFAIAALGVSASEHVFAFAPAGTTLVGQNVSSNTGSLIFASSCSLLPPDPSNLIYGCGGPFESSGYFADFYPGSPPITPGSHPSNNSFGFGNAGIAGIGAYSYQVTDSTVPEPGSIVLLMTVVSALGLVVKKKRRHP